MVCVSLASMEVCIVGSNFFMKVVEQLLMMAVVVLNSFAKDVERFLTMMYEVMVEVVVVVLNKIDVQVTQFVETRAKE